MKRINNLYSKIVTIENLILADQKASRGKSWQYGVMVHRNNMNENIHQLYEQLQAKTYKTSPYTVFKIYEPKEREIYRLPYYPDRITHHAVMNVLEPVFTSVFTADTFSCIKGKGIHGAANAVKSALRDQPGTQYCLKLDIKKFYPSIDHEILKQLLRRKFKDQDLLWLLDEIIDSAPGLPIGNYLSQYLSNFYLTYFDHWIKEKKSIRYYFRYADDLVILSSSKQHLHELFIEISQYLFENLRLQVKSNWQVFPVASRGIDFVGYVFFHTHIRVRKTIKQNFCRMLAKRPNINSVASYYGWLKHCNSNHLLKTINHVQFWRYEYSGSGEQFYRGQDQTGQNIKPAGDRSQLQNRGFQFSEKGG